MNVHGRRLLASAAACAIGAMAVAALQPGVAAAAPSNDLNLIFDDAPIPLRPSGDTRWVLLSSDRSTDVALQDVTVTIATDAVSGVANVRVPAGEKHTCTTAASAITCQITDFALAAHDVESLFDLAITPADGAKKGDRGTISITVRAKDLDPITTTERIVVAEPVRLAGGPHLTVDAAPGSPLAFPVTVRNTGGTAIDEVVVAIYPGRSISYGKRYSNCEYLDYLAYCHFDTALAAYSEYALSEPMRFALDADAPAPSAPDPNPTVGQDDYYPFETAFWWETPADEEGFLAAFHSRHPVRGTDGPISLVKKASALRANGQTDTDGNGSNNRTSAVVRTTGTNTADQAAVGTTVRGGVGTVVSAKVGIKNLGPALVGLFERSYASSAVVTVPTGTTVVKVPTWCLPSVGGQPDLKRTERTGAAEYHCVVFSPTLGVNEEYSWEFGLRIDTAAEGSGTITVKQAAKDVDSNPRNDTAKIVISGPLPAAPAGGILPVTGTDAGLIAAAGAGLVALGSYGYVLARRRRIRFTA